MPASPEQLYEQTLVIRSQIGDESAFADLLKLHGPRLLLFIRGMMQHAPEQVADLTQEIWITVFRMLPKLREADKFKPWLFRIARDRVFQEFRRRHLPLQSMQHEDCAEIAEESATDSPVDVESLTQCLSRLTPEHREVLILRFFEELDYEEISRVTSVTTGTVRSRIHYGKRALRQLWKDQDP